ncbi:MAG: carboxymuconolactone decarboxylase family protein [Spongiibacteraceae bacterium]
MQQRLDHQMLAPELARALGGVNFALSKSGLGSILIDLVFLRVSQLNGCAYCVDMHGHDLLKSGESMRRINAVAAWREAPYFDERERVVLAWVEALTLLGNGPVPDAIYEPLQKHFNDKEIVELTYAIAVINAWNRIGVGFSLQPGDTNSRWPEER